MNQKILHDYLIKRKGAKEASFLFDTEIFNTNRTSVDKFADIYVPKEVFSLSFRRSIFLVMKRCADIVFSIIGILLCLPVFPIFCMIIKMDSKGPVLFRQKRLGKDGKPFVMLKFRSMVNDAERIKHTLFNQNEVNGPMFKIQGDPRLTRFGTFARKRKLDELPQLWNVLMGDMTLVGPRPLSSEEMRSNEEWKETRLKVNPGLTGFWQVECKDYKAFDEWINLDTYYVKNQSFGLDIKIILKTIAIFMKRNVSFKYS